MGRLNRMTDYDEYTVHRRDLRWRRSLARASLIASGVVLLAYFVLFGATAGLAYLLVGCLAVLLPISLYLACFQCPRCGKACFAPPDSRLIEPWRRNCVHC